MTHSSCLFKEMLSAERETSLFAVGHVHSDASSFQVLDSGGPQKLMFYAQPSSCGSVIRVAIRK